MTKEALTLALEALEDKYFDRPEAHIAKAITAIKEALSSEAMTSSPNGEAQPEQERCENCGEFGVCCQPEQEPVAWYHAEDYKTYFTTIPSKDLIKSGYWEPLYITQSQRKPLSNKQIWELHDGYLNPVEFARAIEAAHGIKENT